MKSFTLTTRRAVAGACALLALGLAGAAQAAWPDKPVTLVVPYSAG
ncbi:MAG TPA: tripartite tricarboxylate transporter substrate binding protein BugD, partial [Alicycliphilus denitrificans]|nr:tripartite tricarboxylate transporter substrate binding protein BugD [Alicycliphilus denitrificans]